MWCVSSINLKVDTWKISEKWIEFQWCSDRSLGWEFGNSSSIWMIHHLLLRSLGNFRVKARRIPKTVFYKCCEVLCWTFSYSETFPNRLDLLIEYLSQYKMQCMSCNAEMDYGFVVKEYRFCSLDCLQMKLSWEKIKRMTGSTKKRSRMH